MLIAHPEGRVQDFPYAKYAIKDVPVSTESARRWLKVYFESTTGRKVERIYEQGGRTEVDLAPVADVDDASDDAKNEKLFAIYCMGVSYTYFSIARDGSIVLRGFYTKPDTKKRYLLVTGRVASRLYRAVLRDDLWNHINSGAKIESDVLVEWQQALDQASRNLDDLLEKVARLADEIDRRTDDWLYDVGKRADEAIDAAGRTFRDLGDRARKGLKELFK